jgi:peroxiredoxin
VDSLSRDFNYKLDAIQNKYPETYVGEVFCPLARNIVPPMAMSTRRDRRTYMLTHYFDYTDFSDARIVYNDLFSAKIQQYLQSQAASQGMAAFEPLTDSLLQRAAQNQRVEDFMMNHLFELFDLRGPSNMIPYLRKHHLDRLKYPTEKTLTILQRAKALEPGKPAPDLAYQDTSGTVRSLRDNLGEEVTLLYVWSSNCDHCLKHTPDVHELYQRYKRQGFAVYAVGLERNAESWKEQIRQMGLSWTNVSELKGYESSVTTKYGVRSTPSLILIDGQGRILARNVHPNNLKAQLQKYLEG